jgi:methionine-rich copper-binding protein CopC
MSGERDEHDEHGRAKVTISLRDAAGEVVSEGATASFVTAPLRPGTYEAVFHVTVARDGHVTEHAHRFSFSVP